MVLKVQLGLLVKRDLKGSKGWLDLRVPMALLVTLEKRALPETRDPQDFLVQ